MEVWKLGRRYNSKFLERWRENGRRLTGQAEQRGTAGVERASGDQEPRGSQSAKQNLRAALGSEQVVKEGREWGREVNTARGVGATLRHIVMGFRSQGSRGKNESFVAGWWIEVYRWPTKEWSSGWYQNLSPRISDSTRQRNHSFKVLRGNELKTPLCTRLSDIFKELLILLIFIGILFD